MKETEPEKAAKDFASLMQTMAIKFIKPMERHKKSSISSLQMHVIFILSKNECMTMTDLSRELDISKPQLTPIIDKLIACEYVKREHDSLDRRSLKISITSKGVEFLRQYREGIINDIKNKFEALDENELALLHNSLIDIHAIINKLI